MPIKGAGHTQFTRRDFLKVASVGLGALAFKPFNLEATPGLTPPGLLPTPSQVLAIIKAENEASKGVTLGLGILFIPKVDWRVKIAALSVALSSCAQRKELPPGVDVTETQKATVTAQVTALPEQVNPLLNPTPAAPEVISTAESDNGQPSIIDGLNMGEVTPGNYIGMVPQYETTGINTYYDPNDSPEQLVKEDGSIVEAIPPRAYGVDQSQLKSLFGVNPDAEDGVVGNYNGAPVTLKNGIWTSETGDVCIPFSRVYKEQKAALAMTAGGEFQKVNVVTGEKIGSKFPMFQTPTETAIRLKKEATDNDPENITYKDVIPENVVGVEMNKYGSLNFIQPEARAIKGDLKNTKQVKIIHEVDFLGKAEDLLQNAVVLNSADRIAQEMVKKGKGTTKEELMTNGAEVKRIAGVDKDGKPKNYDVVTIKTDGKTTEYPLAILNRETGSQEKVDMNKLFDMVGMDYDMYPAWDEENKSVWDEWLKEADTLVPDNASTQRAIDKNNGTTEFLDSFFRRTTKNKQGLRMNSVFWDAGDVSEVIKGENDPIKVEKFMRERISQLMKLGPTEMNIVLEAFDLIDGRNVWAETPWYSAFGEDWPVKAFQFAQEEAEKLKITLGKDIKLYWNDFRLDKPGPHLDLTLQIIDKIIQKGHHIDGVGLQIYNGMNNKYYPHVPDKDEMMQVIRSIGERSLHTYLEYGVFRNPANTPELVPVAAEIFNTCLELNRDQPGMVRSINFVDDYSPASPLDPNSFAFYNKVTYLPNKNYYDLQAQMVESMAQV